MNREPKTRFQLIDGIRGIAIVNMVLFHFCYDYYVISGSNPGWPALPQIRLWQQFICWTFLLVSGLAWNFSVRNHLRRGILLNLLGLLISLVTLLAVPQEVIWFGILNCIGCCVLLMIPLSRLTQNIPPVPGMAVCFACFLLTRGVPRGFLGIEGLFTLPLPRCLYEARILLPFGFLFEGFHSSDFFPLFPWLFLYMTGYFFGHLFLQKENWQKHALTPLPLLSAIGRKSIWIYLIHQPVCMAVCMLLFS